MTSTFSVASEMYFLNCSLFHIDLGRRGKSFKLITIPQACQSLSRNCLEATNNDFPNSPANLMARMAEFCLITQKTSLTINRIGFFSSSLRRPTFLDFEIDCSPGNTSISQKTGNSRFKSRSKLQGGVSSCFTQC
jgi:hypothetical protein